MGRYWRLAGLVLVAALIAAVAALVHRTGGTSTAYLNLILIPVMLAAALGGVAGGIFFGLLAGLALGPLMPLDTAAGVEQPTLNWTMRAGIYLFLGAFAGWLFTLLDQRTHQLVEQVRCHPLSGLPNRGPLTQDIRERMTRAGSGARPARIFAISLQLDNYEDIMAALGFTVEEPLLREITTRLHAAADRHAAAVYHIHDGHFFLVLGHTARRADCLMLIQGATERLQQPFEVLGIPIHLDAHAGLAAFPFHEEEDAGRLLAKAWMAMQDASRNGRRYRTWSLRRNEERRRTVKRLGELRVALEQAQLRLHYQPRIALANGALTGFEALLRWEHPELGLLTPDTFIPLAEPTGLIHPITGFALERAATDLTAFRATGLGVPVSVNISARDFLDPRFAERVLAIMRDARLDPRALELEFTETAIMSDPDEVITALRRLTDAGIALSIDDFGTGYSSLSYLKRLPVTTLKIDQSFVRHMARQRVDEQITRASVRLARDLGLRVVAEGAEDTETLDRLRELGCDEVQGYAIARPMPAREALEWAHHYRPDPTRARRGGAPAPPPARR